MKLEYVLGIVIDPRYNFCVGITKLRGPAFLLGKLTFPGGKLKPDESTVTAMSRELREEVGIVVPENAWVAYERFETDEYILNKFAAVSDQVLAARQCEQEPVWHLAVKRHLQYARNQPEQYAPDFVKTLEDAMTALGLTIPVGVPEYC